MNTSSIANVQALHAKRKSFQSSVCAIWYIESNIRAPVLSYLFILLQKSDIMLQEASSFISFYQLVLKV